MIEAITATRTKVELPKFKNGLKLYYFVETESSRADDDEIAHRCNVHPDLVTALEKALAYLSGTDDHDDIVEVTVAAEDALKLVGRAEAPKQKRVNCPNETTTGQCLHPHCDCTEAVEAVCPFCATAAVDANTGECRACGASASEVEASEAEVQS